MSWLKNLKIWTKTSDAPSVTHKDLEFAFKDLDGRSYYRIPAVMALPIERFGKAQEFIMWMSAGMTASELQSLIQVAKKEVELMVDGKVKNWVKVGAVLNEIEMRSNLVMHTDLLYQFVAVHYIRDDEPIDQFIEKIQDEKVQAFEKMVRHGGAYGFFSQVPELANINKSMNLSPEEWEEYYHASKMEIKRLAKMTEYLKSERKFEQDKKTMTAS